MGVDWPGTGAFAIVPNDSANLPKDARAVWVGVTGDMTIMTVNGSIESFLNVPVGMFRMQCRRVFATGTTASALVAVL